MERTILLRPVLLVTFFETAGFEQEKFLMFLAIGLECSVLVD